MVAPLIGAWTSEGTVFDNEVTGAASLEPTARKEAALQVLTRSEPVTRLAEHLGVSRTFLYEQAKKAGVALDAAFAPSCRENDDVLFRVPMTKDLRDQLVLGLVLICHSSVRGVCELMQSVLGYSIGEGTVHNIVHQAVAKARAVNETQDLCAIRHAALDEIFQSHRPVLVGADTDSTYCFLLSAQEHRDETTWGVLLLELAARGLVPDYTVADGGKGLRAGQAAAWGNQIPCHGDVFHGERELGKLAIFLENRASGCTTGRQKLEGKMQRSKKRGKGQKHSKQLALAREAEAKAVQLAADIRLLADWLQNDILSLAGPDLATRRGLLAFVVDELRQREELCPHRIGPVRRMLETQGPDLLAFAGVLDQRFVEIATQFKLPLFLVHAVCELQGLDENHRAYWQRRATLHKKLPGRFHDVETAVRQAMAQTPRASSIIENLNSRLRNYFFLRRHLGNDYLHLLRFFLNHRCYRRSDRPERVGKSPAELLNGQTHPHWLELLGHQRLQSS